MAIDSPQAVADDKQALDPEAKASFRAVMKVTNVRSLVCALIAFAWFATQLYMSVVPTAVPVGEQRAIHLGFAMLLASLRACS